MTSPTVAIIILTWNGLALTQRCLESLRAHTRGVRYTITVVDNGSSDGTCAWLREQPDIRLIANEQNLGYVRGNNQAIAATPPEHDILLLNNDTELVDADWLAHLQAVAHSHPGYGIVGCTLFFPDGRLQHAGAWMPPDTFWGVQIGGGQLDIGQYPGVRVVESVTGACMYIRADLRAAIGGLNEAFVSYYEDTDYCLRAAQAGFQTVCTGGTRIIHHENSSTKLNRVDWRTLFQRGQQTFLEQWHSHYRHPHPALGWHGQSTGPSGSARFTQELLGALAQRGAEVALHDPNAPGDQLHPYGDPHLDRMAQRRFDPQTPQVVCTPTDATAALQAERRVMLLLPHNGTLTAEQVTQANRMTECWVPGAWAARIARDCGVQRPLQIVPASINPDFLHPNIRGQRIARRHVFLAPASARTLTLLDTLLRAYTRAFDAQEPVLLLLRLLDMHGEAQRVVQSYAQSGAAIAVLNQPVPAYQIGAIYRSADCVVSLHSGMNLTALEAMACGLPVIAPDCDGPQEYLADGAGYLVQMQNRVVDETHLAECLRHVYKHRDEARQVGTRAAMVAAGRTWDQAACVVLEQIRGS